MGLRWRKEKIRLGLRWVDLRGGEMAWQISEKVRDRSREIERDGIERERENGKWWEEEIYPRTLMGYRLVVPVILGSAERERERRQGETETLLCLFLFLFSF